MTNWEYRVVEMDQDCNIRLNIASESVGVALDKLGQEGWELVSTSTSPLRENETLLYFKRKERRSIF